MSAWGEHIGQQQILPPDPLTIILNAIGDVKDLVSDVRENDIAYLKTRMDAQWESLSQLEKSKADRAEVLQLESRMQEHIRMAVGRTSDDIIRVEQLAENSDASFESLQKQLNDIEKETAKLPKMDEAIADLRTAISELRKQMNRFNRAYWQIVGASTAALTIGLTGGFFLKMFVHVNWLSGPFPWR